MYNINKNQFFIYIRMTTALCFLINNTINKENVWKKWIEPNKDIINVYIHYKDYTTIESEWIKKHCIPLNSIVRTSYYHVVPAYMALLYFSINHDVNNQWFCFYPSHAFQLYLRRNFAFYLIDTNTKVFYSGEKHGGMLSIINVQIWHYLQKNFN